MGKYKTVAQNTLWVFIGTSGSKLISIIMLPLYTRWLSVDDFGAVDAMNVYAYLLSPIICMCIADAIFLYPKMADDQKKVEYFSSGVTFLFLTIAISAILFFIAKCCISFFSDDNLFVSSTWYIYLLMASTYIQSFFQSFSRSLDHIFHYSVSGIILTFAVAVFSFLLIPDFGTAGYVYALVLASLTAAIYSIVTSKAICYFKLSAVKWESLKEMLSYSIPLIPSGIMWWLVNGLNRPVMEYNLGLYAMGIYALANRFSGMFSSVLNILSLGWINSAIDEYGKPSFESFYNNYLRILVTILFFLGCGIILFSRILVSLFATPDYYEAYKYIPVLSLGAIISGIAGVVGGVFGIVKKSKYFFYSSIGGGVCSVITLVIFTPILGLMGTCFSVVCSFVCILVMRVYYSRQYVKHFNGMMYLQFLLIFIVLSAIEYATDSPWRYSIYIFLLFYSLYLCRGDISTIRSLILSKLNRNNSPTE